MANILFSTIALTCALCTSCKSTDLERENVPAMEKALDSYVDEAGKGKAPLDAVIVPQHAKVIGERYISWRP